MPSSTNPWTSEAAPKLPFQSISGVMAGFIRIFQTKGEKHQNDITLDNGVFQK